MANKNKTQSREFKLRVARMHVHERMRVREIADTLNIPTQTIYGWCKQYREYGEELAFVGCGNHRQQELEVIRLRGDNVRLRQENTRLRKENALLRGGGGEAFPQSPSGQEEIA